MMKVNLNLLVKLFYCLILFIFAFSISFASEINLYDEPNNSAKIIGKVDLSTGIIPIFTDKNKQWIKVGNPHNGEVGWIRGEDIKNQKESSSVFFTQKFITDDKGGPQTYQIIQYGTPQKLSDQQVKDMILKLQLQQQQLQKNMQKSVQQIMENLNTLYHESWDMFKTNTQVPYIMPVFIVPTDKNAPTHGEEKKPEMKKLNSIKEKPVDKK